MQVKHFKKKGGGIYFSRWYCNKDNFRIIVPLHIEADMTFVFINQANFFVCLDLCECVRVCV